MAKNMLPMKTGSGIMSKLIGLLVGLAILMLVIKYPSDAASWVTGAAHLLTQIVGGLVAFFRQISH